MKIKNCILATMVAVILFVSFLNTFAHPGRTDSNGGHWNRATGEYHFHTGEYAGKSHSSSSSSKSSGNFKEPYEPPTDNPYKNVEDDEYNDKDDKSIDWFTIIILFIFLGIPILMSIVALLICICFEYSPRRNILSFKNALDEYESSLGRINTNIQIPALYEIGNDGLPKEKCASSDWGKTFTLYKTDSGTKIHAKYNCCSAKKPVHIYHYRNNSNVLCQKCSHGYDIPDMLWYGSHLQNKELRERLKALQKEIPGMHKKCNSKIIKWLIVFRSKTKALLNESNEKYYKLRYKR